ncbi:MAG: FtsX-like permease family protein [Phycisphaerae bacterium]|nr:FtsX-like permease family protein [Phycisphaerae bacterium]
MGEYLAWPWFWPAALAGGAALVALAALVLLAPVYKHIVCLKYLFGGWKAVVPIVSALPAALGVFLLILVFAIMDGFVMETREMTRGTLSDIIVDAHLGGLPYYDDFAERIERIEGVEATTPIIQTYVIARIKSSGGRLKPIVRPCVLIGIRPAEKAKMGRFVSYLESWRTITGDLEDEKEKMERFLEYLHRLYAVDATPEALQRLLDVPPELQNPGGPPRAGTIAGSAVVGVPMTDYLVETVQVGAGRRVLAWFLAAVMMVVALFVWRAQVHRPGRKGWVLATVLCALSAAALVAAAVFIPVRPGRVLRPEVVDYPILARGDDLVVSTIPVRASGALETDPGGIPKVSSRAFALVDTFKSNYWEADSTHVYADFAVAQQMTGMEGDESRGIPARASQIQVKISENAQADAIVGRIGEAWEAFQAERPDADLPTVSINTWETQQQMILTIAKVQRNITTLMLGLMFVGFAVLIALISYVMAYIKSRDVGILKAVGASDMGVGSLFLGYGFLIGLVGTALGMIGALLMLHYLDGIELWVNQALGVDVFPRTMYYFDHIPRHLSPWWCVGVGGAVLVLATLASMVGGLLAAIRQPVETLRYE